MPRITPFLWFDDQAEEAAEHYVSIFENSRITNISRYNEAGPGEPGSVMTVSFELDGQPFVGINGGPVQHFTEAVSFVVDCQTQEEVDRYWQRLSDGGEENVCGWLRDRFGLSWQITPRILLDLLDDPDRAKAARVMAAMLQMKKIDIAALERAAEETAA